MRIVPTTVAVLATALMFSSLVGPAQAVSKYKSFDFLDIFGTPGKPAQAGSSGTDTIVYFGTCKNLLGIVSAGNADDDGFCLPYESLTGDQGVSASGATAGSDASCQITKSWSYGEYSEGGGSKTFTKPGDCSVWREKFEGGGSGEQ